jgi:hypothetical protein
MVSGSECVNGSLSTAAGILAAAAAHGTVETVLVFGVVCAQARRLASYHGGCRLTQPIRTQLQQQVQQRTAANFSAMQAGGDRLQQYTVGS